MMLDDKIFVWCPKLDGHRELSVCQNHRVQPWKCPKKCYIKVSLKEAKDGGTSNTSNKI